MSYFLRLLIALATVLTLLSPAHAEDEFLPSKVAFQFSARMLDAQTIEASWRIADGYYMYREQFKFKAAGAQLGVAQIPPGKVKFDETFNKDVETFRHRVTIRVPVQAAGAFTLTATSQGCADKGLCYPPQEVAARLSPRGRSAVPDGAFGLPATSRPAIR